MKKLGFRSLVFCFFLMPEIAFAQPAVIITEIGACASGDGEWIEVFNTSAQSLDLTQWKFFEQNTNHSITALDGSTSLAAGAYAVIVDKQSDFVAIFPTYAGRIFDSSWSSLTNSGESLGMKDAAGSIDPAETFTYPACTSGKSWARTSATADPQLPASWQVIDNHGNPGVSDFLPEVPVPPPLTFQSGTPTVVRITEIQPHHIGDEEVFF